MIYKKSIKPLILVTVFSIAMAALEAIVVVYLREIYYPDGFRFPLVYIPPGIFLIEILREVATLVMLVCIGIMLGKNRIQRFAYFLLSFAIWDIFYYVWLKVLLNWPESLLTWDILFLIPVTWVGPVLAPVLCSLTMIIMGLFIINIEDSKRKLIIKPLDWVLIISGAVLIFITFTIDYTMLVYHEGNKYGFSELNRNENFISAVTSFIPESFNWFIFFVGELVIFVGIALFFRRSKKMNNA